MIKSFMRAVLVAQKHLQTLILVTFIGAALVAPAVSVAQNLGTAPATGQAVQGQTASQPEGAFLNLVNWVCNVICPVGAGSPQALAEHRLLSGSRAGDRHFVCRESEQ